MKYRKEDLYRDVRDAWSQGYSIKEISELTGAKYYTVLNWTRDLREPEQRPGNLEKKPMWDDIREEYEKGVPPRVLAEKYGVSKTTIHNYMTYRGIKRGKSEEESTVAGKVSKTLDMRALSAEAEAKKTEVKPVTKAGLTVGTVSFKGQSGGFMIDLANGCAFVCALDNEERVIKLPVENLLVFAQECVKAASMADSLTKLLEA